MSTKTHTTQPTHASEAVQLLEQALAILALPPRPAVTIKQRKAATRSRKGMEKIIPILANLSDEHGVIVPKEPTSQLTSSLTRVSELEPVRQKLVGFLALLEDDIDTTRSGAWATASTLYGMLRRVAHRDAQVTSQLAPVREFFAFRSKAAKAKAAALAAEKEAAAKATANGSAAASTTAARTAASKVVIPYDP